MYVNLITYAGFDVVKAKYVPFYTLPVLYVVFDPTIFYSSISTHHWQNVHSVFTNSRMNRTAAATETTSSRRKWKYENFRKTNDKYHPNVAERISPKWLVNVSNVLKCILLYERYTAHTHNTTYIPSCILTIFIWQGVLLSSNSNSTLICGCQDCGNDAQGISSLKYVAPIRSIVICIYI